MDKNIKVLSRDYNADITADDIFGSNEGFGWDSSVRTMIEARRDALSKGCVPPIFLRDLHNENPSEITSEITDELDKKENIDIYSELNIVIKKLDTIKITLDDLQNRLHRLLSLKPQ